MQINGVFSAFSSVRCKGEEGAAKLRFSGRSQASYCLGFKDQGVGTRETGHRRAQWKNIYSARNHRGLDRQREASALIQLWVNGQRNKNTRIAFGTINIGAHAKTHMRCTIVSQTFQERGQLFQKMSQPFRKVGYSVRKANINKQHFGVTGSSQVVPWFVFGSSLVFNPRLKYQVQKNRILIKVLFTRISNFISLAVVPTLYGTTLQPYGCVPARSTPFYVLRSSLKVGTFRAQYSKCHPRHFFT